MLLLVQLLILSSSVLAATSEKKHLEAFANLRCNNRAKLPTPEYGSDDIVFTACAEETYNAPVSRVYDALVDFRNYYKWNTFVVNVTGRDGDKIAPPKVGLKLLFTNAGIVPIATIPSFEKVTILEPNLVPGDRHEGKGEKHTAVAIAAWRSDATGVGTTLLAEHPSILVDVGRGRTRIVSYESYYGSLAPAVRDSIGTTLQRLFEVQVADLKAYVEGRQYFEV